MNFLARFGDRHDRKDKKMPDRSQSVEPTSTPLSPDSNPRSHPDTPSAPTNSPGTPTDLDWALAEGVDNEAAQHVHGKRRTVSISRSGRYKSKNKDRSRIPSEEVYSGMSVAVASPTSPAPPQPLPQLQKDLVKPIGRDKSPARPYIILKSDANSVNFAIESTSL